MVTWTTNEPVTAVVKYGSDCRSLSATTAASPLGLSGSAVIELPATAFAMFQIVATTPGGATVQSSCTPAYFPSMQLSVEVSAMPGYGNLYAVEDGIAVRIRLRNDGCVAIPGPITLEKLALNGVSPRKSDGSVDLPRDLTVPALESGETRDVDGVMFSRSEVGLPSGSDATLWGSIRYGEKQNVAVAGKVRLP